MSRSSKSAGRVRAVLSSAVAALALGLTGCEDRGSANKDALDKLYEGLAKVSAAPDAPAGEQFKAADQVLQAAAQTSGAGPAVQAVTNAAVAHIDQTAAAGGATKLAVLEADVRGTLLQLRRLGDLLASANAAAQAAAASADAKDAIEKISADITAIKGDAQSATFAVGQVNVPTLSAAKAAADRLGAEITERQQQIATMGQQRTDALATAEQQNAHAGQLKGAEAVKAFADASESRRKADDLAIKIDLVQDQLARLQADSAMQQGQAAVLEAGVKALHEQGQLVETDRGQTQKASAAFKTVAQTILDGSEESKASVKATAAELRTKLDALAAARSGVLGTLTEAEKAANTANTQAGQLASSFSAKLTTPGKEADAYKSLKATVNAPQYMLLLGTVRRDAATVSASEGTLLLDVKEVVEAVKKTVSDAGLPPVEDLDKVDVSVAKSLSDEANSKYKDAIEALQNAESGDAPEKLKTAAKVARLIALEGRLRLVEARKAAGDPIADADPAAIKSDAIAVKGELEQANVPLPALPGELGEPTPPATAPAADPAAPAPAPAT